jgi:aconitate decarboxylase
MSEYTRSVAEYIANSHAEAIPEDLNRWMKMLVLDSIGCGLLASQFPWTQRLLDTLVATEAPGTSLVWGTDKRFSAASASMVNGTAVHGFELDDVGAGGHNGSVTVTTALALAEAGAPLSGKELIRSVVTGVEIAARISDCVGRVPHVTCGFHGPGIYGAFGAMAASSAVLKLDTEQTINAIGNVAQQAGGLMGTHHGGMGKRLLAGKAAHSGVLAAQLAQHGFTNVDNIFECGYGSFPSAFSGARETFNLQALREGFGEMFRAYAVNYKVWACRVPIHPSLEAIKTIRKTNPLDPSQIEQVNVALPEGSFRAVGFPYKPSTITSAQLNIQYCIAIMLLENDVFINQFTEEKIKSPEVMDLVSKINVFHDPSLDNQAGGTISRETIVEVKLADGETIRQRGVVRGSDMDDGSDGNEPNPVRWEEIVEKFRKTTENRLQDSDREALIELCDNLDQVDDARELIKYLQA